MPTGYTARIIDGDVNTFYEFAKICLRAFGAAIHMRDDSMDKEYEPRVPDEYYMENINEYTERLKLIESQSDEELVKDHKKSIEERKKDYSVYIKKAEKLREKLTPFLENAITWAPPTPEHENIRVFMIEQLEMTIKSDCDVDYYNDALKEADVEIEHLDAKIIRATLVESINESITYYQKSYDDSVKNCNSSNEWVKTLLNSLNKNQ